MRARKTPSRSWITPRSSSPPTSLPQLSDAQWTQTKGAIQGYAEATILPAIYAARKDDKREVEDLTKLIMRDNSLYTASYQLALAMQRIIKAEKKPENQPPMFWQFARAIAYTGPGALPAATKTSATKYLTDAYTLFHGSADGLSDLLAMAKTNPFPPANWTIKSTVDIATEQEAARQADIAKNPLMYTWIQDVKEKLATDGGDATWDANVKDTAASASRRQTACSSVLRRDDHFHDAGD